MYIDAYLSWLMWDPNPIAFTIPILRHPVTWYGILFAFGFGVTYFFVRKIFTSEIIHEHPKDTKLLAISLTDRITLLVIIGTIIGARLGHVFFYGWDYYRHHLLDIFKVWEGGLASHGAAVGILIAIFIFTRWHRKRFPSLTFLATLDAVVIAGAFVGGCIRIGNFINQEILGVPTTLPWGVIFLHPIGSVRGVPLHPVQLYESLFYFATFVFLVVVWRKGGERIGRGILSGFFFLLVFTFRFLIEYLKISQSHLVADKSWLNMGQILSLPLIALGVVLLLTKRFRRKVS